VEVAGYSTTSFSDRMRGAGSDSSSYCVLKFDLVGVQKVGAADGCEVVVWYDWGGGCFDYRDRFGLTELRTRRLSLSMLHISMMRESATVYICLHTIFVLLLQSREY
jgi:hypothetical protein